MALQKRYRRQSQPVRQAITFACWVTIALCVVWLANRYIIKPTSFSTATSLRASRGLRPSNTPAVSFHPVCEDTCAKAKDGVCDDGSAESYIAPSQIACDLGTDCSDCKPFMKPTVSSRSGHQSLLAPVPHKVPHAAAATAQAGQHCISSPRQRHESLVTLHAAVPASITAAAPCAPTQLVHQHRTTLPIPLASPHTISYLPKPPPPCPQPHPRRTPPAEPSSSQPVQFILSHNVSLQLRNTSTLPSFKQPITKAEDDPDVSAMVHHYGALEGGITRVGA